MKTNFETKNHRCIIDVKNGKLLYLKMNMVPFLNLKIFLILEIGSYIEMARDIM